MKIFSKIIAILPSILLAIALALVFLPFFYETTQNGIITYPSTLVMFGGESLLSDGINTFATGFKINIFFSAAFQFIGTAMLVLFLGRKKVNIQMLGIFFSLIALVIFLSPNIWLNMLGSGFSFTNVIVGPYPYVAAFLLIGAILASCANIYTLERFSSQK